MSGTNLYDRIVNAAKSGRSARPVDQEREAAVAEQCGIHLWHWLGNDAGLKPDEIHNAVDLLIEVDGKTLAALKWLSTRAAEHITEDG